MKLEITPMVNGHGFRVVRAKAVIYPSVKLGIPRRYQKTWTVRTVAPELTARESKPMFEAEANRWLSQVMSNIARDNEFKRVVAEQREKLCATT